METEVMMTMGLSAFVLGAVVGAGLMELRARTREGRAAKRAEREAWRMARVIYRRAE
jgi:hypothetical protein